MVRQATFFREKEWEERREDPEEKKEEEGRKEERRKKPEEDSPPRKKKKREERKYANVSTEKFHPSSGNDTQERTETEGSLNASKKKEVFASLQEDARLVS